MAVEQTEWFEPWLQWNHSKTRSRKALALQTGSAFKETGERVREVPLYPKMEWTIPLPSVTLTVQTGGGNQKRSYEMNTINNIAYLGIDLGKNTFHFVWHRQGRTSILEEKAEPNSCSPLLGNPGAMYGRHGGLWWVALLGSRLASAHEVRLMSPQFVKALCQKQ